MLVYDVYKNKAVKVETFKTKRAYKKHIRKEF
jgi:hypothetical protein